MDKVEKFMLDQRPLLKEVSSALSRQRIKTRVTAEAVLYDHPQYEAEKLKLAQMIDLLEQIREVENQPNTPLQ
jgi:hypothetical protein